MDVVFDVDDVVDDGAVVIVFGVVAAAVADASLFGCWKLLFLLSMCLVLLMLLSMLLLLLLLVMLFAIAMALSMLLMLLLLLPLLLKSEVAAAVVFASVIAGTRNTVAPLHSSSSWFHHTYPSSINDGKLPLTLLGKTGYMNQSIADINISNNNSNVFVHKKVEGGWCCEKRATRCYELPQ